MPLTRSVAATLEATVLEPSEVALQVAVAPFPGATVSDDAGGHAGRPAAAGRRGADPTGSRMHVLEAPVGRLDVSYRATVRAGSTRSR